MMSSSHSNSRMIRGDTLIRAGQCNSPIPDSGPIINPTMINKAALQVI
jgi:hypothetical protein